MLKSEFSSLLENIVSESLSRDKLSPVNQLPVFKFMENQILFKQRFGILIFNQEWLISDSVHN